MEIVGRNLYDLKIHINDPELYTENPIKKKEFDMRFKNSSSGESKPKGDIFSKTAKQTSIPVSVEKDTLVIGVALSKFTPYIHFKNIIAEILHVHVDCLENNEESLLKDQDAFSIIDTKTVVGNKSFSFTIKSSTKSRINGYANISLPIINKIVNTTTSTSNKYKVHERVSEIQYCLYNMDVSNIDIVRLMNLNNTSGLFSRILLHSFKLNDFNDERSNGKIYLKSRIKAIDPSYGVETYRNVCTFYYNKRISDKENYIRLHQINVFQNGIITLTFKNINFDYSFSSLIDSIERFLSSSFKKIFSEIHIEEAIYMERLPVFIHKFMCCNYAVEIHAKTKISQVHFINSIPGFKSVYSMYTSQRTFAPQSYGSSTDLLMEKTHNITQYYQETLLNYNYATLVQVNVNERNTLISINNVTDFDFGMVIVSLLMNKLTIAEKEKKMHAKTTDDILEYLCSVDSKVRLKQLKDADPVMFNSRSINGRDNSYSQLVQRDVQRPSVVSQEDYLIVKKDKPDSCLELENQTTHERIYLICPFQSNPYANFHDFPNQLCVPKCTVNFSNETQYNICDKQLGGENFKSVSNEFSSTTIIRFNASIDTGRRCLPPTELQNIFSKNYFLKLPNEEVIQAYVGQKYSLRSFIIERCNGYYNVLTEFVYPNEYALILREEGTNNHLILCDLDTRNPFIIRFNSDISFVQQLIKTSMYRHDVSFVIKYVNNVCKTDFDTSMKLMDFVRLFREKYDVKFINKQDDISVIIGFIFDHHVYSCPHFFNLGFQSINIRDVMYAKNVKEPYPKISDLDLSGIYKQYVDFERQDVVAVNYFGTDILIMPTHQKLVEVDAEFIDYPPFIFTLFGFKPEVISRPKSESSIIHVNDLLKLMVTILMEDRIEVNLDNLKKRFKNNVSTKNDLVFINNEVSWRESKISDKLLKNINFDKFALTKLIYENIKSEYTIKHNVMEEYLYTEDGVDQNK